MTRCEDVMKRSPVCLTERSTATEAARQMRDSGVGFLPVCDAGKSPIGTITDRDLTLRILAEGRPHDTPIKDCMTREVIACRPGDELGKATFLMGEHQKSRIMVVDPGGKLVGVISLSDIADRDQRRAAETLGKVTSREVHA